MAAASLAGVLAFPDTRALTWLAAVVAGVPTAALLALVLIGGALRLLVGNGRNLR